EMGGDVQHLLIAIERAGSGPPVKLGSSQSQPGLRVPAFECPCEGLHGFAVTAKPQRCVTPTKMGSMEVGGDVQYPLIALERAGNGSPFEFGSSQSQPGLRVSVFECARKGLHGFAMAAKLQRCLAPTEVGFR